jgi:hypothetical protein
MKPLALAALASWTVVLAGCAAPATASPASDLVVRLACPDPLPPDLECHADAAGALAITGNGGRVESIFLFAATSVTIQGLRVEGGGVQALLPRACNCTLTLRDLVIAGHDGETGVQVTVGAPLESGNPRLVLENVTIQGHETAALTAIDQVQADRLRIHCRAEGVVLHNAAWLHLSNASIEGCRGAALRLHDTPASLLSNVTLAGNALGAELGGTSIHPDPALRPGHEWQHARLLGNANGIRVSGGASLSISCARFEGNGKPDLPSATEITAQAIQAASGNLRVQDSVFLGNGFAVSAPALEPSVLARQNWWGQATGPLVALSDLGPVVPGFERVSPGVDAGDPLDREPAGCWSPAGSALGGDEPALSPTASAAT